jgi:hypothetical protein
MGDENAEVVGRHRPVTIDVGREVGAALPELILKDAKIGAVDDSVTVDVR